MTYKTSRKSLKPTVNYIHESNLSQLNSKTAFICKKSRSLIKKLILKYLFKSFEINIVNDNVLISALETFSLASIVYSTIYMERLSFGENFNFYEYFYTFLTCNIIATKYLIDYNLSNEVLTRNFDINISQINYNEGKVLASLNYEISVKDEHFCAAIQKFLILTEK
ncbi:hypothetical protein NUSPORA_01537 [Nucleospora cyclopteri]